MEPNQQNQTSKQSITRVTEIKNNLTVTRGEVGRDKGGKWRSVFRNNCKGHMGKTKAGVGSGEVGGDGWHWGAVGGLNADNCT